jgi:hypothetical protein
MAKTDYKTIDQYHKAHPAEVVERMPGEGDANDSVS